MRQTVRFFLNVTIAVFVVMVGTLTTQLIADAPMPVGGRIAGLQIHSVFIPGRNIPCVQDGQQDRCQINLFDRPLEITLIPIPTPEGVKQCQISYAGQTVDCKGNYHTFIIGGWMPVISTDNLLGLSAEQRESLREQYPQRNFFLQDVGEARLLSGATGAAIAAGILAFLFGWLNFPRRSIFFGIIVLVVTWLSAHLMLLGLGYVD